MVIETLRELNEPVPKPPRLPTERDVQAVERELGVTFHPDYRQFLLEASDVTLGALEPATITEPGSHTHLPRVARDAWDLGVPRELLPICEDNGDYYCMDATGRIAFWSHDGGFTGRWPDLATWIRRVWIDESAGDGNLDEAEDEDEDEPEE
jgi:hypothetical protein